MGTARIGTASEKAGWFRRYRTALRKHLEQGPGANPQSTGRLGRQAVALGLEMLDLARFHEQAIMTLVSQTDSSMARQRTIERARSFFAEAIVPIEKTHRPALKADLRVNQLTRTLRQRTAESSASVHCLKQSILLRRRGEHAIKVNGKRHTALLAKLHRLRKRLRDLPRTCLSMQEDQRQEMSLRLHDEIAQSLIAIDLRLLTLKNAARTGTAGHKKEIDGTQRLVQESARKIDRFAHEFGIQHET